MNLKNKTAIIIQARTGSSRLPKKMLLPFYNNQNILEIILKRIKKQYQEKYNIILATTTNKNDDDIEKIGNNLNINVYRGDENDVLKRFIDAALFYNSNNIIRVCADNPFLDTNHIDNLISLGNKNEFDYVSYKFEENIPVIKSHLGLFTEFTTLKTLKKIQEQTQEPYYHEHVTNYIYENNNNFNIKLIDLPEQLSKNKDIRLTLDTVEDFKILQEIYSSIANKGVNIENIINFINKNKSIKKLMKKQIEKNKK